MRAVGVMRVEARRVLIALGLLMVGHAAHAVSLSRDGAGQALVYPWYTVNAGQDTMLTLVNLENDAKAVKLRFLEGYNSRDVLDLNVYLAPGDVWTAVVTEDGEGARLVSHDVSCTVPAFTAANGHALKFATQGFDGTGPMPADRGPAGLARTREGHVQVIEMGVVVGESAKALSPRRVDPGDGTEVWPGGSPADCARLQGAWEEGGYWANDPSIDLVPPSSGLTGSASIVDVAGGVVLNYTPDALADFHEAGRGRMHTAPGVLEPNLASGSSKTAHLHQSLTSRVSDPATRTVMFGRGIDAVTAVFMKRGVANEFWSTPGIGAASEWVLTYPTKRFYTDPFYVGEHAQAPFHETFRIHDGAAQSCTRDLEFAVRDRNGAWFGNRWDGFNLPSLGKGPQLCRAAQVVTFEQREPQAPPDFDPAPPSAVLGSRLVTADLSPGFDSGWAVLAFDGFGNGDLAGSDGEIAVLANRSRGSWRQSSSTGRWMASSPTTPLRRHIAPTCHAPRIRSSSGRGSGCVGTLAADGGFDRTASTCIRSNLPGMA